MYVAIVGGGRTGSELAHELINLNHEVVVIEKDRSTLESLHRELPTEVIIHGTIADPQVWEAAEMQRADVLAAVSSVDEFNLVACYLARELFKVPRIIARVNNPGDAWLFNETFHVDIAINNAELMTRIIQEEMSMGDMMTLLKFKSGKFSLVEEKISKGAPGIGLEIKDLQMEGSAVIAAIIRNGEMVFPRGNTMFMEGDEVLAVTDEEGAGWLARLLTGPKMSRDSV